MENASKALIIAASVLVAILIIALGVTIFNRASNSADTSSLDQTEINMFNQKFERYANSQLGSQVKSLISFAISNAGTNKEDVIKLPTVTLDKKMGASGSPEDYNIADNANGGVSITNDTTHQTYVENLGKIRSAITSTHPYTVNLDYGTGGLVSKIEIKW